MSSVIGRLTTKAYYPWIVVGLCGAVLMQKYILQVSPGVMTNELMRTFHVHGVGLGNLAATFFYAYVFMQLFVGPLLDRYSPRLLTTAAIVICSIGAMVFSEAQTFTVALLGRGLLGVGAAFATINYMKMAAQWFDEKNYAFVAGLMATMCMAGSTLGQAPLAYLTAQYGWRSTLLAVGILGLPFALLYFIVIRDWPPVGSPLKSMPDSPPPGWREFKVVLKSKHNWLLVMYSGLAFAPVAVLGGLWGTPYFRVYYNLSNSAAAALVSAMFVGLAIGAPVYGRIAVRNGKPLRIMAWGLILGFISLTAAIYLPPISVWLAAVSLFVFGFATGAFLLGFVVGRSLSSIAMVATVTGLINTGDAIFGAFSEPLVGRLLDAMAEGVYQSGTAEFSIHEYHVAFSILPLYQLIALLFLWLLHRDIISNYNS